MWPILAGFAESSGPFFRKMKRYLLKGLRNPNSSLALPLTFGFREVLGHEKDVHQRNERLQERVRTNLLQLEGDSKALGPVRFGPELANVGDHPGDFVNVAS